MFSPDAAAEIILGPRSDETQLSETQQTIRNVRDQAQILYLLGVLPRAFAGGLIPIPPVSLAAEAAGIAAENGLKWTKPVLVAPPDLHVRANSPDGCRYEFELPQTVAEYSNFWGLVPKLGGDVLLNPFDEPVDFGPLDGAEPGENLWNKPLRAPYIYHATVDVDLSVSSLTPGLINEAELVPPLTGWYFERIDPQQTVSAEPGTHTIQWKATSKWSFLWDAAVPTALFSTGIVAE